MLKLNAIFKDGMILQRNSSVCVWGESDAEYVEVDFGGAKYPTKADGGRFSVNITTSASDEAMRMIILAKNHPDDEAKERVEINDILLGEVWLAGGQSNMELELQNSLNADEVMRKADYDRIRFYNVPKIPVVGEELIQSEQHTCWKKVRAADCRDMSAVAFYFAKKLYEELNVPIGIIDCYWGGTSATCWVSDKQLESVEKVRDYINEWQQICEEKSDEQFDAELNKFNSEFNAWQDKVNELKADNPQIEWSKINEIAGPCPWNPPRGRKSPYRPFGLYESMISRIVPYGLRGFIYYQGEEDGGRADYYSELNTAVIRQWRRDFGNLPFYITQLPMFIADGAEDDKSWAVLRQQQELCGRLNDDVGVAVICDCGEYDNIHPVDKEIPGNRLALLALLHTYKSDCGRDNMTVSGSDFNGKSCELEFANTYGRICCGCSDGKTLTARSRREILEDGAVPSGKIFGFEVSGDGEHFHIPSISIKDNKIILSCDNTSEITHVRYGWFNYGVANLYSKEGMPLMPFMITKQ